MSTRRDRRDLSRFVAATDPRLAGVPPTERGRHVDVQGAVALGRGVVLRAASPVGAVTLLALATGCTAAVVGMSRAVMVLAAVTYLTAVRALATLRVEDLDGDGLAFAWERAAMVARWLGDGVRRNKSGQLVQDAPISYGAAHAAWAAVAVGVGLRFSAALALACWVAGYASIGTLFAAHLWSRAARRWDGKQSERRRQANLTPKSDDIFTARCTKAGVVAAGFPVPKPLRHSVTPQEETFVARLREGSTLDGFRRFQGAFATSTTGVLGVTIERAPGGDARMVVVSFRRKERVLVPRASVIVWRTPDGRDPVEVLPTSSIREPIPFGLELAEDGTETPFVVDLDRAPHVIVNGGSGGGKSNDMHLIVGAAHLCPDARLHIADAKAGMEFGAFRRHASSFADEADQCVALVLDCMATMRATAKVMSRDGRRKLDPTPADPWNILVVDELATLARSLGDRRAEFEAGFMTMMEQGRAIGWQLVVGTQTPRADTIKVAGWRGNFGTAVGTRTSSDVDSRVILGDDSQSLGWRLKDLPDHKAARIVRNASGYHRVFTPFTDDRQIDRILAVTHGRPTPANDVRPTPQVVIPDEAPAQRANIAGRTQSAEVIPDENSADQSGPETPLVEVAFSDDRAESANRRPDFNGMPSGPAVWDALGHLGEGQASHLVEMTGLSRDTVDRVLSALRFGGWVEQSRPRGPWRITGQTAKQAL